jgi:hypothetical protein
MKYQICAVLFLSACADTRPNRPDEVEWQETDCLVVLSSLGAKLHYTGNSELLVRASATPAVFDQETGDEIHSEWYTDVSFSYPEFCERMSERVVVNSRTGAELDLTYFLVVP